MTAIESQVAYRQVRVFVPPAVPYGDNWVVELLGRVVKPLASHKDLVSYWFTRYVSEPGRDEGDCDISRIGTANLFKGRYRSIRFRYAVSAAHREPFELGLTSAIAAAKCVSSGPLDYDLTEDLGSNRFSPDGSDRGARVRRAEMVLRILSASSVLVIEQIYKARDDDRYELERSVDSENPHGSVWESIHHLLCNVTDVPTYVLTDAAGAIVGTNWNIVGVPKSETRIWY